MKQTNRQKDLLTLPLCLYVCVNILKIIHYYSFDKPLFT